MQYKTCELESERGRSWCRGPAALSSVEMACLSLEKKSEPILSSPRRLRLSSKPLVRIIEIAFSIAFTSS